MRCSSRQQKYQFPGMLLHLYVKEEKLIGSSFAAFTICSAVKVTGADLQPAMCKQDVQAVSHSHTKKLFLSIPRPPLPQKKKESPVASLAPFSQPLHPLDCVIGRTLRVSYAGANALSGGHCQKVEISLSPDPGAQSATVPPKSSHPEPAAVTYAAQEEVSGV